MTVPRSGGRVAYSEDVLHPQLGRRGKLAPS